MTQTTVLGISMSNHDRAACLLADGIPVAAVSEERLDRRKRSDGFYRRAPSGLVLPPAAAITYVLRAANVLLDDVDLVVCGRSLASCRDVLLRHLPVQRERVVEPPVPGHHLAHAYSAYMTSRSEPGAILVIDEHGHDLCDGTFEKCTWFASDGGRVMPLRRFVGDAGDLSLGMFFDVFATFTGLSEAGVPSAGKLMGLAAHGRHRPEWPALIDLHGDGDARVSLASLDRFLDVSGLLHVRAGGADVRCLDDLLLRYVPVHWNTTLAADLARKAQDELERAVLHIASSLRAHAEGSHLAYAGGVALNCVATTRLLEAGWSDVSVHPAATDDGTAVGLAAYGWVEVLGGEQRRPRHRVATCLGRMYSDDEHSAALAYYGLASFAERVDPAAAAAERVNDGNIVCWFHGRSEWGPRALGGRSVIADPRMPGITCRLNADVKHREPFRPFGVSGTQAALSELLDLSGVPPSLYGLMLAVAPTRDDRLAPVRHADGTVRFQVVDPHEQSVWHELLIQFGERSGIAAVVNTSFNALGEPLVESPCDAVRHFVLSRADHLVLGRWLVARSAVSADVLRSARARAWADTPIDTLELALSLEAAGDPDAAEYVLAELADRIGTGADATRARQLHALRQRLLRRYGDDEGARLEALQILRLSGLPREALEAASFLATVGPSAPSERFAARALRRIGETGAGLPFLVDVLAGDD